MKRRILAFFMALCMLVTVVPLNIFAAENENVQDTNVCEHTGEWTTVKEATCTEEGSEKQVCSKCNEENTRVVEKVNHQLAFVEAIDATCTEGGTKAYYTCTECEKWFEDEDATKEIMDKNSVLIEALGHSFTEYKSNDDATCIEDGTKTAKCDRCEKTKTVNDTGSALRHDFGTTWKQDKDYHWRGCSRCDEIDAMELHTLEDEICTICGYVAEHVHELTQVKAVKATCASEGSKEYYACSGCDDWFADALGEEVIKDKETVKIAPLDHSYSRYSPNNDATCTADGTKTAVCDKCGATDTVVDEGSKLEHTFNSVWLATETTHWYECTKCTAKEKVGEHVFKGDECTVCEYMREHVHNLTLVAAKDATCTTEGNTAYYTCSGCDKWFEDAAGSKLIADKTYVVVKALEHKFTDYKANNNATCTTDGTKTAKCDRCDVTNTVTDTGSKLPHNYGIYGTEKTCVKCGFENLDIPEKKDVTIEFNTLASKVVYTGDVIELSEDVVDVTRGAGDVIFKYYIDETCETPTYEGKAKEGKASSLAGVYYVKAFVEENDDYKAAEAEGVHVLTVSPRKPETLSAVNKKSHIQLSWEKTPEATGYIIYRRLHGTSASAYEVIETITNKNTLSFDDKDIKIGARYMYSIAAYKDAEDGTEVVGTRVSKAAQIVRSKIKGVKNYNGYIKLTWNKVEDADAYEIWRKVIGKDDAYKRIKTIKDGSTSYKDESSKAIVNGRRSYYKVVVKFNDSKSTIGESYGIVNNYMKRPTISSVKASSKAFTVKWDKNSSATGYEIMYSTSSSFEDAKTVIVTSSSTVSKKISKLKAGKKYYVKVRSYKTYNDTNYSSAWSGYKSVKVK